jgi:CO/xanthine dehydrogenase Mo-binding subunit
MAESKLTGRDYTTPDLVAKVTGRAKYAEDYRADGMLFTKLLLSPMPHARVKRLDTTTAMALPGVKAILTADDLPDLRGAERALTNEPYYQGEPILAVAAVDESIAAEAIERIALDLEPLPFVVDPVESLRPTGANARLTGNVWVTRAAAPGTPPQQARPEVQTLKWSDADFANAPPGALPMGKATDEWSYGDLDAGFKNAAIVVDETFVVQSTGHQPMETRSAMAYWQGGKVYLHVSTQSLIRTVDPIANWCGIKPSDIVLISEYTGGGFGSKGGGAVSMAIPALLKAGMPVMMRISREEEHYIGRARARHGRSCEGRLRQGWSHHGARSLHRRRQRIVRSDGRPSVRRQRRIVDLAAAGDALAWACRPYQYPTAFTAAVTGSDAGKRDHGTGGVQGREAAGTRSAGRFAGSIHPKGRRCMARRVRTARDPTLPAPSSNKPWIAALNCSSGRNGKRAAASARVPKSAASEWLSVRTAPVRSATTV